MKLKNDIQVKAFLIRNKIPFEKFETFLLVDKTRIGEQSLSLLMPYELHEHQIQKKRQYNKPRRQYKVKKPSISQLLQIDPEPEKQPENGITRVKGNYSNTQWNEL